LTGERASRTNTRRAVRAIRHEAGAWLHRRHRDRHGGRPVRIAGAFVGALALFAIVAVAQTLPSPDTSLPGVRPPAAAQPLPSPDTRLPGTAPPGADLRAQPTLGDDRDVIKASEEWLKMLDRGQLGPAWDASAKTLKSSVTRNDWIRGIGDARKPFGKVASRKAEKFARAHQLPGLPEGDYALLLFDTQFANGKKAQEHVTWTFEKGEVWRVAGYFIK
jgi:hypothetical protein